MADRAQLKMYWFTDSPMRELELPEGFSYSHLDPKTDIQAWFDCLRGGQLVDWTTEAMPAYEREILNFMDHSVVPETDVWFLDYAGEHIGTITGFIRKDGKGDMHQVAMRADWRGKGYGKYLCPVVQRDLRARGVKVVELTSGEGRPGALKDYLRAGFLPVEYDVGMQERWENVLWMLKLDSVRMVNEDGTPYRMLYRPEKGR